ncbi:MAG: acylphosphatase [Candidatus Omnitrophica bacterium]|nr:acylphosphatase [Candidatus Omnitrophota bacterium]
MRSKQIHVYYSGMVQGVGFRYQVRNIATEFAVLGLVRNLADGRVELIAEAKQQTLLDFLAKIDAVLSQYVRDKQISWDKAGNDFKGFEITF